MFSKFSLKIVTSIFLFMALMNFLPQAKASIDVYMGLHVGSVLMYESQVGNNYSHQSSFFVGHWGYGLGVRPKIDFGKFSLGLIGEIGWLGDSMERKLVDATDTSNYRNEFHRSIAGASASLNTGASSIIFEYYPWVQNSVFYSDEKAENPFRKNDTLSATGYGVGFNFGFSNGFAYQLLYKNLSYQEVTINGVKISLPSSQFKPLKIDEVTIGFVMRF